jgi:hypothetical protein
MGIFLSHTRMSNGYLPGGYAGDGYPLPSLGRLLTHRAGGKHGDEEDLRWRFPSPAGCREELLDPPDLGSMTAADRDVFLEN